MQGIRKMMPGNEGQFEVSMGGMMLLGGTTTLVTAIVFLLGIYVGKGDYGGAARFGAACC